MALAAAERLAQPPRAIELVGVAASGKTTLYRALAARAEIAPGVPFGGAGHLAWGAVHVGRLLPAWLLRRGRWLSEKELRSLNYVAGWQGGVARRRPGEPPAVFDHGPLFRIARLRAFGPPLVASDAFRRWAEAAVRRWAKLLGAVVWLDAPDELLVTRIEGRDEQHRMKGGAASDTRAFLARYRLAYERLLAELEAAGGPAALRIDTSRASAEVIAERLVARFGLARRHTNPPAAT